MIVILDVPVSKLKNIYPVPWPTELCQDTKTKTAGAIFAVLLIAFGEKIDTKEQEHKDLEWFCKHPRRLRRQRFN